MESHLIIPVIFFHIVEGRQCWYSDNGRTRVFFCAANQQCCDGSCCWLDQAFYTLWYFCPILHYHDTMIMLLFLCASGIYWIRRNYIYHRLLAVPAWNSQQLAQHTLHSGATTAPKKTSIEKLPDTLLLPPYTPPVNPPPYTETDPGSPPLYSSMQCDLDTKSTVMEHQRNVP